MLYLSKSFHIIINYNYNKYIYKQYFIYNLICYIVFFIKVLQINTTRHICIFYEFIIFSIIFQLYLTNFKSDYIIIF